MTDYFVVDSGHILCCMKNVIEYNESMAAGRRFE